MPPPRAYALVRHREATEQKSCTRLITWLLLSTGGAGHQGEGNVDFAATVVRQIRAGFSAAYALAAIPARYTLERSAWAEAAGLGIPHCRTGLPFLHGGLIEYAHALGRAHTATSPVHAARWHGCDNCVTHDGTEVRLFQEPPSTCKAGSISLDCLCGAGRTRPSISAQDGGARDILGKHQFHPERWSDARTTRRFATATGSAQEAQREFERPEIYPGRFRGLYGRAGGRTAGERRKGT